MSAFAYLVEGNISPWLPTRTRPEAPSAPLISASCPIKKSMGRVLFILYCVGSALLFRSTMLRNVVT